MIKMVNGLGLRSRFGFGNWILIFGFHLVLVTWLLGFNQLSFAQDGCYFGIFREGAPKNMKLIESYITDVGKKPAMVMWYLDWEQPFPTEDAAKVIKLGAVPHIVWEPWVWGQQDKIKLDNILRGEKDSYIKEWAKEIKAFGQPVFLRVAHEFNIEGYPWGTVNNGRDPKKYISAFRHIVDIFRKEGTTNVKWIWCFMNFSYPDEPWNDYEAAYPGDAYVDWIGIDGYNLGTTEKWSNWTPFRYLFRDQVRRMRILHPTKPIMIAEFASTENGGNKGAWIKEVPAYLKSSLKDINAALWFDLKKETDWRIKSSPASLNAFKAIMKDPVFLSSGKDLVNLTVAPSPSIISKKEIIVSKANSAPIIMVSKEYLKEGLGWAGAKDLSGKIYLRWDEQNLFIKADVTDSMPLVNNKRRGDIWNGDAIEMVISTNPKANPSRKEFGEGDFQIGLGTGNGKDIKPSVWCWQKMGALQGAEIKVTKNAKPVGYIMEAKIPWASLGNYVPKAGDKVGFDIALDDSDKSGERERQFIWNGDFYFYKDPSVWGAMVFAE